MEPEEQKACDGWMHSVLAEVVGKGQPSELKEGMPEWMAKNGNVRYRRSEVKACLSSLIPPELVQRICSLVPLVGSYWQVWPLLTEAELGIIMQAGASKFLMPAEATP